MTVHANDAQAFLLSLHKRIHAAQTIDLIVERRNQTIYRRCVDLSGAADGWHAFNDYASKVMQFPLNPITIPALIACGIHLGGKYADMIDTLMRGEVVENVEKEICDLEFSNPRFSFEDFLSCHDEYMQGLYYFTFASMAGRRPIMFTAYRPIVEEVYDDCDEYQKTMPLYERAGINLYDVRLHCWVMFNDELTRLYSTDQEDATEGQKRGLARQGLIGHGMRRNSDWHNYREKAETEFENAKRILNADFHNNQNLQSLEVAEFRMRFSQSLYWWNPMELSAKAVALDSYQALRQNPAFKNAGQTES